MRECRSLVVLDWKIKIDKCREDLSNDLSFDLISPALIQMRIISSDEYAKIRFAKKLIFFEIGSLKNEQMKIKIIDHQK